MLLKFAAKCAEALQNHVQQTLPLKQHLAVTASNQADHATLTDSP